MWILLLIVFVLYLAYKILPIFFLSWFYQKKADTHVYRFKYKIFIIEHRKPFYFLLIILLTSIIVSMTICMFGIFKKIKNHISKTAKEENHTLTSDNKSEIHTYKFIIEDTTWSDAYEKCLSDNGHLLSIDSDEEYNYIIDEIERNKLSKYLFYIGAYRPKNDLNYYWTDNKGNLQEKIINDIPYWMSNEPSFKDPTLNIAENYSIFFFYRKEEKWVINDIPNDIIEVVPTYQNHVAYICEYE